jgi:hypothetical protein
MSAYHKNDTVKRDIILPEKVEIGLLDAGATAKEGLLALAVGVGFQVLQAMMEEEVNRVAGPKGKHQPGRQAVRHGKEKGYVILGGRQVRIKRPRVRSTANKEVPLVRSCLVAPGVPVERLHCKQGSPAGHLHHLSAGGPFGARGFGTGALWLGLP